MSDDRVSYMYQRDPSVDRRYRPRPNNARDLFKEISEEDECDSIIVPPLSSNSTVNSQHSTNSDTIDTTASVFLRLRPEKQSCKYYSAQDNVLKVHQVENAATNNKDLTEKHFEFSEIFHIDATQLDVYNRSVHASIQNMESATILTYGMALHLQTHYAAHFDLTILLLLTCLIFICLCRNKWFGQNIYDVWDGK